MQNIHKIETQFKISVSTRKQKCVPDPRRTATNGD